MLRFVIIDTRDLEPPEPLELVLAAVRNHEPHTAICMRHRREPCLLYPLLEKLGFTHHVHRLAEGHYEILIWPKYDTGILQNLERTAFQLPEHEAK